MFLYFYGFCCRKNTIILLNVQAKGVFSVTFCPKKGFFALFCLQDTLISQGKELDYSRNLKKATDYAVNNSYFKITTMRIQGTITQVLPLQEGSSQSGAQWRKQTVVVREDDPDIAFPNEVALDLFNDRIPVQKELAAGQRVDVHFGIRTREWGGRVYNEIIVYKFTL